MSVGYTGQRTGDHAYAAVQAIRDLPAPAGVDVLVGGRSAADVDRLDSLGDRLPWMAAIMAAVTLVLLFFAFGSVLVLARDGPWSPAAGAATRAARNSSDVSHRPVRWMR